MSLLAASLSHRAVGPFFLLLGFFAFSPLSESLCQVGCSSGYVLFVMPGTRSYFNAIRQGDQLTARQALRLRRDLRYRTSHSGPDRRFVECPSIIAADLKKMAKGKALHVALDGANGCDRASGKAAAHAAWKAGFLDRPSYSRARLTLIEADTAKHVSNLTVRSGRPAWADFSDLGSYPPLPAALAVHSDDLDDPILMLVDAPACDKDISTYPLLASDPLPADSLLRASKDSENGLCENTKGALPNSKPTLVPTLEDFSALASFCKDLVLDCEHRLNDTLKDVLIDTRRKLDIETDVMADGFTRIGNRSLSVLEPLHALREDHDKLAAAFEKLAASFRHVRTDDHLHTAFGALRDDFRDMQHDFRDLQRIHETLSSLAADRYLFEGGYARDMHLPLDSPDLGPVAGYFNALILQCEAPRFAPYFLDHLLDYRLDGQVTVPPASASASSPDSARLERVPAVNSESPPPP